MRRYLPAALLLLLVAAGYDRKIQPDYPLPRPFVGFKNRNLTEYLLRNRIPASLTLGEILFRSPAILGAKAAQLGISCNSCHPNGDRNDTFFLPELSSVPGTADLTTGFFHPGAENNISDPLKIPSLRGIRFTPPYGHRGEFATLEQVVRNVVENSFGAPPLDSFQMSSLIHYLKELDYLPRPGLDETFAVRANQLPMVREGEVLFHKSNARGFACATCHMPSAYFQDGRIHRIGSAREKEVSPWSLEGGVNTPSLLLLRENAFFHRGSSDWQGLWQTKAKMGFTFTKNQRRDLTAYLRAVTDAEKPVDARHISEQMIEIISQLRLFREAGTEKYLNLVKETVADEMRLLQSRLSDEESRQKVNSAIDRMKAAGSAAELLSLEEKIRAEFLTLQ